MTSTDTETDTDFEMIPVVDGRPSLLDMPSDVMPLILSADRKQRSHSGKVKYTSTYGQTEPLFSHIAQCFIMLSNAQPSSYGVWDIISAYLTLHQY